MKKKVICTVCMIPFLFLFACSQQETYEQGFPKKESLGLSDFLASYFTQQTSLIPLDDTYVFSEGNESNTDDEIEFYTIHADELKEFYAPLKEEDQTADRLKKLFERTEDIQHIQLVEDYLDGSDEMFAEFDLSYKRIGKQVEFKATNDVSTGKVVYFSEDWIVLFIEYNAPVTGASGSTNVLIDLQDKENPTFYVVDLDII